MVHFLILLFRKRIIPSKQVIGKTYGIKQIASWSYKDLVVKCLFGVRVPGMEGEVGLHLGCHTCVVTVSKQLGKTKDWIVALKGLMLVHRLMNEGPLLF